MTIYVFPLLNYWQTSLRKRRRAQWWDEAHNESMEIFYLQPLSAFGLFCHFGPFWPGGRRRMLLCNFWPQLQLRFNAGLPFANSKFNCWTIMLRRRWVVFIIECTDWIWPSWDSQVPRASRGDNTSTQQCNGTLNIESTFFWGCLFLLWWSKWKMPA